MLKSIFVAVAILGSTVAGLQTSASAQSLERAMATYYRGDYADAIKALTPFATEGDRSAQFYIGYMHERGKGVPQDYSEAAKWYGQSAELGYPFAQNNLGVLYKHGRGVPKDPVAAYKWFGLAADGYQAAELGNRDLALENQESIAAQMTAEQLAEAKKQIEEHRANEPGIPEYRPPNIR
jgi:TPR repeat protein